MAIHLFNDAVPTKWRLINLVLFLISLLLALPICRERKGRERENRLHIYAAHSSLPFPSPVFLCFLFDIWQMPKEKLRTK